MSIHLSRRNNPKHTPRSRRADLREAAMAFAGDPADDGRTAAEAARPALPPLTGSSMYPAPVAVKNRPGSGPWSTEPFAAVPDGDPGGPPMAEMLEAIDARARENNARFYESIGLGGSLMAWHPGKEDPAQVHHEPAGFAGASVAGEVHHEFRYEPQPREVLRRVLDGLRAISTDTDAGPATDLTGQVIFAGMLTERMRHPGSPAGTRCGCCGYKGVGFSDARRSADLSAHVIRELYGGYLGYEDDGWLESAFGEALARIAAQDDQARWDLAATWTGDEPGDVAA